MSTLHFNRRPVIYTVSKELLRLLGNPLCNSCEEKPANYQSIIRNGDAGPRFCTDCKAGKPIVFYVD